jgi:hypothetical protein
VALGATNQATTKTSCPGAPLGELWACRLFSRAPGAPAGSWARLKNEDRWNLYVWHGTCRVELYVFVALARAVFEAAAAAAPRRSMIRGATAQRRRRLPCAGASESRTARMRQPAMTFRHPAAFGAGLPSCMHVPPPPPDERPPFPPCNALPATPRVRPLSTRLARTNVEAGPSRNTIHARRPANDRPRRGAGRCVAQGTTGALAWAQAGLYVWRWPQWSPKRTEMEDGTVCEGGRAAPLTRVDHRLWAPPSTGPGGGQGFQPVPSSRAAASAPCRPAPGAVPRLEPSAPRPTGLQATSPFPPGD